MAEEPFANYGPVQIVPDSVTHLLWPCFKEGGERAAARDAGVAPGSVSFMLHVHRI